MEILKQLFKSLSSYDYLTSKALIKAAQGFSMPDDPEEHGQNYQDVVAEILKLAADISDEDTRNEAFLAAEVYREANEINGGYATAAKIITTFIETALVSDEDISDEEDELQTQLKDILLDIIDEFNKKAQTTPDSKESTSKILGAKNKFRDDDLASQQSFWQASMSGGLQDDEKKKQNIDFIGVKDKDDDKKNVGVIVRKMYEPKDWASSYGKEAAFYIEAVKTETNPKKLAKKKELVAVLTDLVKAYIQEDKLYSELQGAGVADIKQDPEYVELMTHISELRKRRVSIRTSLKSEILEQSFNSYQDKYNELSKHSDKTIEQIESNPSLLFDKSTKIKYMAYLAVTIAQNSLGRFTNVGEENKSRKDLLKFLATMVQNERSTEIIKSLIEKINAASTKKKTKTQHWSEIGDELRFHKEKSKVDITNITGLAIRLSQNIANTKMGEKKTLIARKGQEIYNAATGEQKAQFAREIELLAAAHKSRDKKQLEAALSAMYNAVSARVKTEFLDIAAAGSAFDQDYAPVKAFSDVFSKIAKSKVFETLDIDDQTAKLIINLYKESKEISMLPVLRKSTRELIPDITQALITYIQRVKEFRQQKD